MGFCKAKKKYYYGLKVHMITTHIGQSVEFLITPASTADITGLQKMELDSMARVHGIFKVSKEKEYNQRSAIL